MIQSPSFKMVCSTFIRGPWLSKNGLVINPDNILSGALLNCTACQSIVFVPLTDTVKPLGVTTDRYLTFDSHVQNVCIVYRERAEHAYSPSNCTDFQSATVLITRWRHWLIKCGQREVQHTCFNQSVTMLQPEI